MDGGTSPQTDRWILIIPVLPKTKTDGGTAKAGRFSSAYRCIKGKVNGRTHGGHVVKGKVTFNDTVAKNKTDGGASKTGKLISTVTVSRKTQMDGGISGTEKSISAIMVLPKTKTDGGTAKAGRFSSTLPM